MKYNIIFIIFISLVFAGSIWALIYNFYMSWFRSSDFLEKAIKGVKDWWPFANYFRSYYGSSKWLWITRISTTSCLLIILFFVFQVMFNQLTKLP
jgi:hypothetical protein